MSECNQNGMGELVDLDSNAWVALEGGTFVMGSDNENPFWVGFDDKREVPPHRVTLSPFRIGRYPVTNAQYQRFLDETGQAPAQWARNCTPTGLENHPVVNLTWFDCRAFCEWLTEMIGIGTVDLPTEAQWEFASRGKEGRTYPWGEYEPDPGQANFLPENRNPQAQIGTTPVDAHPLDVTPTGIFNLGGNVSQWCRDWYGPLAAIPVEVTLTKDGTTAVVHQRVMRGGCFCWPVQLSRGAYREGTADWEWSEALGFRVVWAAAEEKDCL